MGHLQQFELELRTRLEALGIESEPDELVAWLKEQVLQSYRNGAATRASTDEDGERAPRRFQKQK